MPVFKWSKTAASNATADSTINWAEGQAPSSVNDSARAEMAAVKKWHDDITGTLTTGGTSTAYTVTSNSSFDSLANMSGSMVAFVPHTTNGGTTTLNVDGLGAKPLRSAPSVELAAGDLVQGTPYLVSYFNATAEWILFNAGFMPAYCPIGGMIPYAGSTAPNSRFVLPFGQAISRNTYANLFNLIGSNYGAGDGSSTFNVPDLRGRTPFGYDNMGGASASRISTALFGAGGAETVTLAQANLPNVNLSSASLGATATGGSASLKTDVLINTGSLMTASAGSNAQLPSTFTYGSSQGTLAVDVVQPTVTMSGVVPLGGSGTAVNKMPPHLVVSYILRVL